MTHYLFSYNKARLVKGLALFVTGLSFSVFSSGSIKSALSNFNHTVATPRTPLAVVMYGLATQQDKLCKTLISLLQQESEEWHATCSLITPNFISNNSMRAEEYTSESIKAAFFSKLEQITRLPLKRLQDKIKITIGDEFTCPLYKLWSAYSGDTVIVNLRPGDIFTHNQALHMLAQAHKSSEVLLTYGRYILETQTEDTQTQTQIISGYKIDRAWSDNKLRLQLFGKGVPGYPLTFKAKLLRSIKLEDLFYGNTFYALTTPEAYWYPLYELARDNSFFMEETILVSEPQEARSRKDSLSLQQVVRAKSYQPIQSSLLDSKNLRVHAQNAHVTVLAYSKDRPLQLYAFLESLGRHVSGSYSTTVIYYATTENYNKAYQEVAQSYPHVKFVAQHESAYDFKTLTLKELYEYSPNADYVLFAVDDLVIKAPVILSTCVYFLEKTQATGFHLRLGKNIIYNYMRNRDAEQPPLYEMGEDVLLWKSNESPGGWHYPYSLDMSLYRKKDIKRALESLVYQTPNKLEEQWAFSVKRSHMNMCFKESKTINVPLNVVQKECPENRHMNLYSPEELLRVFNKNLKIDIEPWYLLCPKAPHVPLTPNFVPRVIRN